MGNDDLARATAEVLALRRMLDDDQDGASPEWVAAAHQTLRRAQARLRALHGADDWADAAVADGPLTLQ